MLCFFSKISWGFSSNKSTNFWQNNKKPDQIFNLKWGARRLWRNHYRNSSFFIRFHEIFWNDHISANFGAAKIVLVLKRSSWSCQCADYKDIWEVDHEIFKISVELKKEHFGRWNIMICPLRFVRFFRPVFRLFTKASLDGILHVFTNFIDYLSQNCVFWWNFWAAKWFIELLP